MKNKNLGLKENIFMSNREDEVFFSNNNHVYQKRVYGCYNLIYCYKLFMRQMCITRFLIIHNATISALSQSLILK